MSLLITVIIALLIGAVAYLVASLVPFTRQFAGIIGLIVAILVFISRMGY